MLFKCKTAGELIEALKTLPPDTEVFVNSHRTPTNVGLGPIVLAAYDDEISPMLFVVEPETEFEFREALQETIAKGTAERRAARMNGST